MAPAKTMAVSQQQQQQQAQSQNQTTGRSAQGDQAIKSRKRKGKQQQQQQQQQQQSQAVAQQSAAAPVDKQQVTNGKLVVSAANGKDNFERKTSTSLTPANSAKQSPATVAQEQQKPTTVTPYERKSIKNQPQSNQVPSSPVKKESTTNTNKLVSPKKEQTSSPSIVSATNTVLAKQISTDEQDDIDAGIELDGSSNSGSSVKDLNEDQIKSTSVSPVMAQSNIVNEERDRTKHAIEVAPIGQLAGSLCQDIAPSSKKAGLTAKQQLAAKQQVIDADEQLVQQKLQSKQQRKSSVQANASSTSLNTSNATANTSTTSQGAPQSPALCKICEQHVYQMERVMAEKSVYHKSCFRCYQCKIQLRVDNYSSHEGQVYCKAHHRQIFQPQVKLDNEDDVDIVAKSNTKVVDDYLLQRGRLSDLSFSFLQPKPEEIQKRQMIICENEPAELPKDVVRSDTKVDDGIDRFNVNLNNILEKFERGNNGGEDSQPSSAGVNIEKPSFNLKKTLMAFETKSINPNEDEEAAKSVLKTERPVVKKLTNLNGFLNRQNSAESETSTSNSTSNNKPLAVRRSESLMMRLKKYESRIAGEQVVDDESDGDENNNSKNEEQANNSLKENITPKKLSSLKSQWENGDISKRRPIEGADVVDGPANSTSDNSNGLSPATEKNEELIKIRQQLARRRSGGSSSIKNIYENAIKEAQQAPAPKLNSSDLSALEGFSTTEIQQQLLQNGSQDNQKSSTPSTPNKDHFQLNLSKKANKLRERFEQGLINNSSYDDSDEENEGDNERNMSKLDQIRQEKLEDLSIFTEGEIKAREARSMFQQIDRRLSAAGGQRQPPNSRSLATISASMQAKLQSQRNPSNESLTQNGNSSSNRNSLQSNNNFSSHLDKCEQSADAQKPIRLVNNVRT